MDKDLQLLRQNALLLSIELNDHQLNQFNIYQTELCKWNTKTNLISENTSGEIVTRHFLDSLTAAKFLTNQNARIVDIGCGAGFPGIPLKIALPSLHLYLLETNRKKVSFLKHIIRLLNLSSTAVLHDRTENIIKIDNWKEKFDVVISRAALKLPELVHLSEYFLAPEGLLIALKGKDIDAELDQCLKGENENKIYQLLQYDINMPLLGPPRKIIIGQKRK